MRAWPCWIVCGLALLAPTSDAGAQEAPGGTAALLPLGGAGYVPYSAGGLGVYPPMPRMREAGGAPMRGLGMPGPRGIGPARPRGGIEPLAPITGRAAMGGATRSIGSAGMGRAIGRPPVGAYPFRRPPGPARPAAGAPMPSM